MAPTKSFRTYGRGSNTSVSSVEAFNILFAKNLTQRKLGKGLKAKNKPKYEVKKLPEKIKTVLNDEHSLRVNINDTFDKVFKNPPNTSTGKIIPYNSSISVIRHLENISKVSPMKKRLTGASKKALDSWFDQPTPTGVGITNTLEIEPVKSTSQTFRRSPRFNHPSTSQQVISKSITIENKSLRKSKSTIFTNSLREKIVMHSSTPVVKNAKRSLLPQAISPIRNFDPVKKCIVESLDEIESWNSTLPTFEENSANEVKSEVKPLSVDLEDFEQFFKSFEGQAHAISRKKLTKSICVEDFEEFHRKFLNSMQYKFCSMTKESFLEFVNSINYITHRKHRPPLRKRLSRTQFEAKDLYIMLDRSLVNFSRSHGNLSNNNRFVQKHLTVDITRLSLNRKVKNARKSLVFKPKDHVDSRSTPCRKFSFNSCLKENTTMNIPNSSRKTSQTIDDSDNENIKDSSELSDKDYIASIWHVESISTEQITLPNRYSINQRRLRSFKRHTIDFSSGNEDTRHSIYTAHDMSSLIFDNSTSHPICFDSRNETSRDQFKVPRIETRLRPTLKSGKSWRRSFLELKRNSIMHPRQSGINDENTRLTTRGLSAFQVIPLNSQRLRRRTALGTYAYSLDNIVEDSKRLTLLKTPTARDIVLGYCEQSEPLPFSKLYPQSVLVDCKKIGEGVYGEVFSYKLPSGQNAVMKVIPIEGEELVNGEKQKRFHEIISEVATATQLSNLRNKKGHRTSTFCEVLKISCVKGKYPPYLLKLWSDYDERKGSENDSPELFKPNQLYIVLNLGDGGQDLESFVFNNASQVFSVFQQLATALAIAEESLQFEHRDLHWGNVLVKAVDKSKKITFESNGDTKDIPSFGVQTTVIDFTLSRINCEGVVMFNDLAQDPELFLSEGDYQFEVYRLMRDRTENNWQKFTPYTNVLWLHYILKKSIEGVRYKNTKAKVHLKYLKALQEQEEAILRFNSVSEFVKCCL